MCKTMFFSGKAVDQTSKQSGLLPWFYYVVVFWCVGVVGINRGFSQFLKDFLLRLSRGFFIVFTSVVSLFIHQIHKTYNNKLQFKLINS